MDSRNVSVFSQSYFITGRRKESNLSLTCKRNNLSDLPVDTSSSKQQTSECLQDEPTNSNFQRCNSAEMEKFLEKFKNPKQTGRQSSNRICKRNSTKVIKNDERKYGKSPKDISSDFKKPHPHASDISSGRDSTKETLNRKVEGLPEAKCFDNSDFIPEGNCETFLEESASVEQTRPEASESSILLCPICWKPFDCKDAQTIHMKACANKHNVSTKRLLELLELIQRQEEERKALGIPLLPTRIPKKVKKDSLISTIKPKSNLDGNIQLGIALSVSLQESNLQKERDHLLEAGLFEEVKEKGLLPDQEVGNENSFPAAPIFLNVGKKGSNIGKDVLKARKKYSKFGGRIPSLLKRTPEDREKLITEKVAIILVGDEQLNSIVSEDKENSPKWEIKSRLLNKFICEEQILWKMASLSPSSSSKDEFYVNSLSNFISPCKHVAGSKLKHLSQIPGRNITPEDKAIPMKLPDFHNIEEDILSSPLSENTKSDSRCDIKKKELKRSLFTESPLTSKQNRLSCDWIVLVGNPEMSDVKVYTEGERLIPAHKLVFFARCPQILKDLVEEEDRGKKSNMLLWVEICYEAAFLFLKYIYGSVFSRSEARIDKVLEDLNLLAERYEVREFIALLKRGDCSKEEYADSLDGVENIVNNSMTCEQNAIEDGESKIVKADVLVVNVRDTSKCKQYNADQVFPKIAEYEHSYICDEKADPTGRIEENDPCLTSEVAKINSNDDIRMNSPSVSDPGRSSPDIFQEIGVADSPESVKVIEDEDLHIKQDLSQDSRESIEYLVSLMEKDSSFHKSSECDPALDEGDKENSQERTGMNSHISESPSLVFQNRTVSEFMDTIPPETPAVGKVAKFITSSTPVIHGTNIFEECNTTTNEDDAASNIDVKRKLQSLDKSDLVSPSPKKIRIEGDADVKNYEKEVVDLTLSDPEEVAVKIPLNDSNCSTLPPPLTDTEEFTPSKDAVPRSPAASPCGYISNVWDDFDYIPDVPKVDFNDSVSASQKNLDEKKIEEGCSRKILVDEEKASTIKIPEFESPLVDCSPDSIILLDETIHKEDVPSPIHNATDSPKKEGNRHSSSIHSIAANPEKEGDITERLLDASLSHINESVFWRDENEPKEGIQESVSVAPCHTPVRPDLKAASSKNETPETPLYAKKTNVTPLADYSAMKTPMLHKELDRYGIKHLKRNQAKQLLRHIYNELHPVVSDENEGKNSDSSSREKELPSTKEKDLPVKDPMEKKKITFESLDSSLEDNNSSSDESSGCDSDFVVLEESIHESQFESPVKSQALSHKGPYIDIPTAMKRLIESDADFHKKILLYEPIWLTDIKDRLKAHGAKFNVKELMDYLDEQCITFRIQQGNNQRRRKKKKTFSLSQPCNQRRKNKQPISSSQPS